MGEGLIKSGGKGGYYHIEIVKNIAKATARRDKLLARVAALDGLIATAATEVATAAAEVNSKQAALDAVIRSYAAQSGSPKTTLKAVIDAQAAVLTAVAALNTKCNYHKRLKFEQESCRKAADLITPELAPEDAGVWCADLSERLSRTVGTLEINGECGTRKQLLIMPGGAAGSGKIEPAIASTPAGVFYNWAVLPGWQKFKPTYRTGVLTAIDFDANTGTVSLDPALSSAQDLDINQASVLSNVPIVYMTCHARAFVVGDAVVVQFQGQNQASPRVIGFVSHPKSCYWEPWGGDGLCTNHNWFIQLSDPFEYSMCPTLPFLRPYGGWYWHDPHALFVRKHPYVAWKVPGLSLVTALSCVGADVGSVDLTDRHFLRTNLSLSVPLDNKYGTYIQMKVAWGVWPGFFGNNTATFWLAYGRGPIADIPIIKNYWIGNTPGVETVIDLSHYNISGPLAGIEIVVSSENDADCICDCAYIDFSNIGG